MKVRSLELSLITKPKYWKHQIDWRWFKFMQIFWGFFKKKKGKLADIWSSVRFNITVLCWLSRPKTILTISVHHLNNDCLTCSYVPPTHTWDPMNLGSDWEKTLNQRRRCTFLWVNTDQEGLRGWNSRRPGNRYSDKTGIFVHQAGVWVISTDIGVEQINY